jgi:hypothetical protein
MKEFLEALAITSTFIFVGYFFFGDIGKTHPGTETMDMGGMDMNGMEMPPAQNDSMEDTGSMPGMSH